MTRFAIGLGSGLLAMMTLHPLTLLIAGAAMALEERPHLDTIQDFRAEEVALNLRRQPPSAKSQAINLARKAIK